MSRPAVDERSDRGIDRRQVVSEQQDTSIVRIILDTEQYGNSNDGRDAKRRKDRRLTFPVSGRDGTANSGYELHSSERLIQKLAPGRPHELPVGTIVSRGRLTMLNRIVSNGPKPNDSTIRGPKVEILYAVSEDQDYKEHRAIKQDEVD